MKSGLKHAHDAVAEAIEQAAQFIAGGPAGAVEDSPVAVKSVGPGVTEACEEAKCQRWFRIQFKPEKEKAVEKD